MPSDPGILILKIFAVIFLVLLNGFFVAAEFAIVKIRDTQLDTLVTKGHRRARMARRLISNLDASLSATQLGITLASLGLGWVGEPVFAALLAPVMEWLQIKSPEARHSIAFVVGFSTITFLHIVAGELAPKSLAIQKPLPTSLWVAHPLHWFYKASYPFIWALNGTSLWLLRRIGIEPASEVELVHSEEELRLLFAGSQKHSTATPLGRDIVLNALDLRRRVARDVMRPRSEIVALDTQASLAECIDIAEKTRFSRFPLCESGDLDHVLGVIHIKDIYAARYRAKTVSDLIPAARKIIYVPETARLERLLQLFLERKLHLALVVDEFGGTMGMVTLENILEELVGQIQDEFDQEKPLATKTSESTWEIEGALPVHDLGELLGQQLEEEGVTTASGWITNRLGGFPKKGDVVTLGPYELRVEEMDGLRVGRLVLRRLPEPTAALETQS
ncbi:MAG: hemolysin family protein [Verrucomicrobia subdivision 3 bacterium]|nr:hemolysin family protein [Limisphaerales bacterium]